MSSPPMIGTWMVEVQDVRPFSIHGDLYFELHVRRPQDPPDQVTVLRVAQHAAPGEPKAGDKLNITFVLGQVTSVKAVGGGQ